MTASSAGPVQSGSGSPRVCILIERYVPHVGGTEKQCRNLASALAARGVEVIFVTRRSRRDLARKGVVDGLPVYRVPMAGETSRYRWILALTCMPALIARRRDYDVLFVASFRTLGLPAVLVARLLGKPCILKAESFGEMSGECFVAGVRDLRLKKLNGLVRLFVGLRNRFVRRAEAMVSMSSEMSAEFREHGIAPARIHCIPNMVDESLFHPAPAGGRDALRAELGLPRDAVLAIYVGRLVTYKGLPLLMQVWARVARRHPEAQLVMVGVGGDDIDNCEAALRAAAAKPDLSGRVTFTGLVEDVHRYLQAADFLVFPTENEAFGLSLIEAMACGLPAIASAVGGVPDIVADGQNGLLFPVRDGDALYRGIVTLLEDAALRSRLGAAALDTVRARYTRRVVAERYLALLKDVTHT